MERPPPIAVPDDPNDHLSHFATPGSSAADALLAHSHSERSATAARGSSAQHERSAVALQAHFRGRRVRLALANLETIATRIQRHAQGMFARNQWQNELFTASDARRQQCEGKTKNQRYAVVL